MELSLNEMKNRMEELERIIERKKREYERLSAKLPAGMLRTAQHGEVFQYYLRENPEEKNGTYLPRKKEKIAAEYALMEYSEKVIRAAEKELAALKKIVGFYENSAVPERIYEKMSLGKRVLVTPIRISDEEFAETWIRDNSSVPKYREEGKIYETSFGERVRSKSEALIAELYHRRNIPFIYEKPLELKDFVTFRPDFTILDRKRRVEIYHEHMGLLDDEEYRNKAIQKINVYGKNGLFLGDRLIVSFETQKSPLDIKSFEKQIQHILNND